MPTEPSPTQITGLDEYQRLAHRTAKLLDFKEGLLHTALGMCTDAGEFGTAVKAYAFYGKAMDFENAKEELGDTLWFLTEAATVLGISLEEIATHNINKLRVRYPGKFTNEDAIARADKKINIGGPQG